MADKFHLLYIRALGSTYDLESEKEEYIGDQFLEELSKSLKGFIYSYENMRERGNMRGP